MAAICVADSLKKSSTTALQPADDKATSRAFIQHFLCTPTRLEKPSTTALQPPDHKATSRKFSHFLRTFSRLKKSSTTALQPPDDKATSRALQLSLPICVYMDRSMNNSLVICLQINVLSRHCSQNKVHMIWLTNWNSGSKNWSFLNDGTMWWCCCLH